MQRRGGRGHGAGPGGEHGLITLDVLVLIGVRDVGRQGHVAVCFEQRKGLGREAQVKHAVVRPAAPQHLGREGAAGKVQQRTGAR